MLLEQERKLGIAYSNTLISRGLTKGTGGNISILNRELGLWTITPSGVEYETMTPADMVVLNLKGEIVEGDRVPSSEKDMHLECYLAREDINAVVHTHSTYATTLACMHKELPAIHYLIGYAGDHVPCIPYYPYGSPELAKAIGKVFATETDLYAQIMGNHGLITAGGDISYAFNAAEEIEFVCEIYYKTLLVGDGVLLDANQMKLVREKFKGYGQKEALHK